MTSGAIPPEVQILTLKFYIMKTLTVKKTDLQHDLSVFPNFSASGSIKGMKDKYYGKNALLIRSGAYVYKVTEEIYNYYL